MITRLKFTPASKSRFFSAARTRVDDYFTENNLSRHANTKMWLKAVLFLTAFFGLYGLIISNVLSPLAMLPMCLLFGTVSAFVGFNICHDAIHGSFSANSTVNKIFSHVFSLLGASPYIWNLSHNMVHHTYTNIPGHDDDIEVAPGLIRISEEKPVNRIQRYQHWYAFPLYSLASFSWAVRKDYLKFFNPIGQLNTKHPKIEYFNLFFFKGLYYFLFLVLPMLVLDITWWQLIIGFMAMHMAQGLTMGLVFQLAHVVEGTDFPMPDEAGNMEEAWAEHQMRTTANFASNCPVAAFFLGGLNRQIEHHLFPKVCHIHYAAIGNILKETALEHNIPYIESPTFVCALKSHYRMLRRFGAEA